jgi:hypothetical protein
VLLSARSKERIGERIRELVPRNWGSSVDACIARLNGYLVGWIGFFGICTEDAARTFRDLDSRIRRRLRAVQLRHWKRRRTIVKKLIAFGINPKLAWHTVYKGHRSTWALSHSPGVDQALRNSHWDARGLVSIGLRWRRMQEQVVAPAQLALVLG